MCTWFVIVTGCKIAVRNVSDTPKINNNFILISSLLFSVYEFYLLSKMYVRFLEEKNLFIMNSSVKMLIPILYRIFFEFWREF